jgi:6-phosphogluconolactonase (cycloisomerase 2 family)
MPDLGSDRVWVVKREGPSGLKIHGYLQAPEGAGPRHAVLSLDGTFEHEGNETLC